LPQTILDLCNLISFVTGGLILLYLAYGVLLSKKEKREMSEIEEKYGKLWLLYIVLLLIVAFSANSMMLTNMLTLVHEHGAVQFQSTYHALKAGSINSGEYVRKIKEISDIGLRMMFVFTALNFIGVTAFYLALRTMGKYNMALEKHVKGAGEINGLEQYALNKE